MHAHLIAAGSPDGSWQYATESWSKGGAILGLVILVALIAAVTAAVKAS